MSDKRRRARLISRWNGKKSFRCRVPFIIGRLWFGVNLKRNPHAWFIILTIGRKNWQIQSWWKPRYAYWKTRITQGEKEQ